MLFQLFEKSGYSLKYRVSADDSGAGLDFRAQNTMADEAGPGPLKALLKKPLSPAQWVSLVGVVTPGSPQQKNAPLSVHVTPHFNDDTSLPSGASAELVFAGPGNSLGVGLDAASASCIVEIRFHHSMVR